MFILKLFKQFELIRIIAINEKQKNVISLSQLNVVVNASKLKQEAIFKNKSHVHGHLGITAFGTATKPQIPCSDLVGTTGSVLRFRKHVVSKTWRVK